MRRIAALCCLLPLLAGCAGPVSLGKPPARQPTCPSPDAQATDKVDPGVVLIAQSVPSASWIPCVSPLPVGFRYERLEATNDGSQLWLSSGIEGNDAVVVSLSETCDVRGAQETRSAPSGMRRYQRITDLGSVYRGKWFFVFPGGCVTYQFDLRGDSAAESAAVIAAALGFVSRETVARLVDDYSDGRLHLDPTPARSSG